jgi:hypothetical protein
MGVQGTKCSVYCNPCQAGSPTGMAGESHVITCTAKTFVKTDLHLEVSDQVNNQFLCEASITLDEVLYLKKPLYRGS